MKINEICNRTFFGKFQIGEVKIKQTSPQSFTEIWALRIPVSMRFGLRKYYEACAHRCGYIY